MARVLLRGRSAAMSAALGVLRSVRRSGHGAAILITGDAGIGKSALLVTVLAESAPLNFARGAGRADSTGRLSPAAPVLFALRSGAQPLLPPAALSEFEGLIDRPLLLLDAVTLRLERLAGTGPLLIAVDDVHALDPLSRFLLRSLPARLARSPIVWVFAGRPDPDGLVGDLSRPGPDDVPVTPVALGPLAAADLAAIAQDRLGRVPDGDTRARLDRASGNAALAVLILDGISHAQALGRAPEQAPPELVLGLRRQLGRLPPDAAEMIRLTAVLAQPFSLADVAGLLPQLPTDRIPGLVGAAVQAGLLTTHRYRYAFRYELIREIVHADLPEDARRAAHRRCARHLLDTGHPAAAVAGHARAGLVPGDEAGARILAEVAVALAPADPTAAGDLMLQAFRALAPPQPAWFLIGERAIGVLALVQRCPEAIAVADLLLAHADDSELTARIEISAVRIRCPRGDLNAPMLRSERILARDDLPPALRARLTGLLALARTRVRPARQTLPAAEDALAGAELNGDRAAISLSRQALAEAARKSGDHARSLRHFRRLRAEDETGFLAQEIIGLQYLDRYPDAETLLEHAGDDHPAALPSLVRARMQQEYDLSRLDRAAAAAARLQALGRSLGNRLLVLDAASVLSSVALLRGDPPATAASADPPASAEEEQRVPGILLSRAWNLAADGDPGQAVTLLAPLVSGAHEGRDPWPWKPDWLPALARWGTACGETAFVDEVVALAQTGAAGNRGVASLTGIALQVKGLADRDTGLLAQAAEVLSRSPRPLLQARADEDLGRELFRREAPSEGIVALDRALESYRRLGAHGPGTALQRYLRAAGFRRAPLAGRPERPRNGWDSLTPTEIRVAQLIGAGHTNREAAGELGVSVNTVGTHVRSVFGKLGVRSRVQLTNLMRDEALPEALLTHSR